MLLPAPKYQICDLTLNLEMDVNYTCYSNFLVCLKTASIFMGVDLMAFNMLKYM